jgi:hypothetical protein
MLFAHALFSEAERWEIYVPLILLRTFTCGMAVTGFRDWRASFRDQSEVGAIRWQQMEGLKWNEKSKLCISIKGRWSSPVSSKL